MVNPCRASDRTRKHATGLDHHAAGVPGHIQNGWETLLTVLFYFSLLGV